MTTTGGATYGVARETYPMMRPESALTYARAVAPIQPSAIVDRPFGNLAVVAGYAYVAKFSRGRIPAMMPMAPVARIVTGDNSTFTMIAHNGHMSEYSADELIAARFINSSGYRSMRSEFNSASNAANVVEYARIMAETDALRDAFTHDTMVLLQAFTGGAIRHGWEDQFDNEIDALGSHLGKYVPFTFPDSHQRASMVIALVRAVQSGELATGSRMFDATGISIIPGVNAGAATYLTTRDESALVPFIGISAVVSDETIVAARVELTRLRDDFHAAWGSAWEVLDEAATNYDWCSEYESTSEGILAHCLVAATGANRRQDYVVYGTVDVTVTVTVPVSVSTIVSARNSDDAAELADFDDSEIDSSEVAESLLNAVGNMDYRRMRAFIGDYDIEPGSLEIDSVEES